MPDLVCRQHAERAQLIERERDLLHRPPGIRAEPLAGLGVVDVGAMPRRVVLVELE